MSKRPPQGKRLSLCKIWSRRYHPTSSRTPLVTRWCTSILPRRFGTLSRRFKCQLRPLIELRHSRSNLLNSCWLQATASQSLDRCSHSKPILCQTINRWSTYLKVKTREDRNSRCTFISRNQKRGSLAKNYCCLKRRWSAGSRSASRITRRFRS